MIIENKNYFNICMTKTINERNDIYVLNNKKKSPFNVGCSTLPLLGIVYIITVFVLKEGFGISWLSRNIIALIIIFILFGIVYSIEFSGFLDNNYDKYCKYLSLLSDDPFFYGITKNFYCENYKDYEKFRKLLEEKKYPVSDEELITLNIAFNSYSNYQVFTEYFQVSNPACKSQNELVVLFYKTFAENYLEYLEIFKLWLGNVLDKDYLTIDNSEIKSIIQNYVEEKKYESFKEKMTSQSNNKSQYEFDINNMNGYDFEDFLSKLFNKLGYSVIQTPKSGDQGADLIIQKFEKTYVVQAKRYSTPVGNRAIQEVVASIKHYNADGGLVFTNSTFTRSAIELAKSNDVQLFDNEKLTNLIEEFLYKV